MDPLADPMHSCKQLYIGGACAVLTDSLLTSNLLDGTKELIKYYRVGVKAAYTVKSLLKLTYVLGLSTRFFTIHTVWSDSHAHCIVYMQIAINARFNSMHPLSGYSTLSNLFGVNQRRHACRAALTLCTTCHRA